LVRPTGVPIRQVVSFDQIPSLRSLQFRHAIRKAYFLDHDRRAFEKIGRSRRELRQAGT
jgi:hypothetical protein